jgi:CubicO group peptidase (beta-lactamase class C family)
MIVLLFAACSEEAMYEVVEEREAIEFAFDSCRAEKFNTYFKSRFKRKQFNGNVLIAHGDSVFRASYGWANYRRKDSLSIESTFQLASVSKPITALAVLQLVDQGKLSLSDTIGKYIENWPYPRVTIEHLLNHRSGLGNYLYHTDEHWEDKSIAMCNKEAVALFTELKPEIYYPLDKRFDYCNTNYMLLASIVEQVSGESFETYMANHFFAPLQMQLAFINSSMERPSDGLVATGHTHRMRIYEPFYLNGTVGDKGVYASVDDLYALHKALRNGEVIPDSLYQLMITPASKFNRRGQSYGLGWRIRRMENGEELTYHNGWWRGFRSYFIHLPKEEATIIVLTNTVKGKFIAQDELLDLVFTNYGAVLKS